MSGIEIASQYASFRFNLGSDGRVAEVEFIVSNEDDEEWITAQKTKLLRLKKHIDWLSMVLDSISISKDPM